MVGASHSEFDLPARDALEGVGIERLEFRAAVEERRLDRFGDALAGIKRIKRDFAPDVIHLGTVGWSTVFHLLTRDAWPAPWLLTLTQERLASQTSADDTVLGRALESADWVSSVSAAVLDQAIELSPGVAARSSVDYWGMPEPPGMPPASFDPPRVLCVGRLVPAKGFDLAVEALPALARRHPGLSLAIVGDGPERARLESLAREAEVEESVSFEGWISPERVCSRMAEATVVVLPSHQEGLPVVAIEAARTPLSDEQRSAARPCDQAGMERRCAAVLVPEEELRMEGAAPVVERQPVHVPEPARYRAASAILAHDRVGPPL